MLKGICAESRHHHGLCKVASDDRFRLQHWVALIEIFSDLFVTVYVVRRVLVKFFWPLLHLAVIFAHEKLLEVEIENFVANEHIDGHKYDFGYTFALTEVCELEKAAHTKTVCHLVLQVIPILKGIVTELLQLLIDVDSFIEVLLLLFA